MLQFKKSVSGPSTKKFVVLLGFGLIMALAGCTSSTSPAPTLPPGTATPGQTASILTTPTASVAPIPTPTPTATPTPTPTATPTPKPTATPAPKLTHTLYLRLWSEMPQIGAANFFSDVPIVISLNLHFYHMPTGQSLPPSPLLYVSPVSQSMTQASIDKIVAAAQSYGLLSTTLPPFVCPVPQWLVLNAAVTYIQMTVDNVTYNLSGTCNAQYTPNFSSPVSGSYNAFVAFVAHLEDMSHWSGITLGPVTPWAPAALAVETAVSSGDAFWDITSPPSSNNGNWPGPAYSNQSCLITNALQTTSLLSQVPGMPDSTIFVDSLHVGRVLALRPLMPGEPSTGIC